MNEKVTENMYFIWEVYDISLKKDIETLIINWRSNDLEALDTSIGYAKNTLTNLLNAISDLESEIENGKKNDAVSS